MNHFVDFLSQHGLMLLTGTTCLLAVGAGAMLCFRSPIHRQRVAQGTVAMVLLWLVLACLPLPRLSVFRFLDSKDTDRPVAGRDSAELPTNIESFDVTENDAVEEGEIDAEAIPMVVYESLWEPEVEPAASQDDVPAAEFVFPVAQEDVAVWPSDSVLLQQPPVVEPTEQAISQAAPSSVPVVAIHFDPHEGLTTGYLFGAMLFGGWLLLGRFLLMRMKRLAKPSPAWAAEMMYSLCEENNIRPPQLLISATCRRPIAFGLFVPTILLPQAICKRDRSEQLRQVLLHELAHVGQRDAWGCALLNAVLPLLYFHPLYWWIRHQSDLAAELVADDWAAARSSRVGYVDALLKLCIQHGRSELASWGTLGVFRSTTQFTRRMEMLLQRTGRLATRCSWFWRTALAMLLLSTVGIAAALWGIGQPVVAQQKDGGNGVEAEPATDIADNQEKVATDGIVETMPSPSQWGLTNHRNNVAQVRNLPSDWNVATGQNIRWKTVLRDKKGGGSFPFGQMGVMPVVHGGKIFIGTNNTAGHVKLTPTVPNHDRGVLLCLDEKTGKTLWVHGNKKLPDLRKHDWPLIGLTSSPCVEGDRLWYVNNRCEVVCLDTEGFGDKQNDGPFKDEQKKNVGQADVIWKLDMIEKLKVSPKIRSSCSVTVLGDILFVSTGNGTGSDYQNIPSPGSPSFMALDKKTGEIYWTDSSPGKNILNGQWSSPVVAKLGNVWQVIFAGGDGWLYSFRADRGHLNLKTEMREPTLLWKFDCNPKESKWLGGGKGTRNSILAVPVVYDGRVYVATGRDPEQGEGPGRLVCIDPTKRGDISSQIVVTENDRTKFSRQARTEAIWEGLIAIDNPNSALVWDYTSSDDNRNGKIDFEETMHRSVTSVAIDKGLLIAADTAGIVHCLDAKTGQVHWGYDMLASVQATPLIADGKVYVGDEDGDLVVFPLNTGKFRKHSEPGSTKHFDSPIYATPTAVGDTLYVATQKMLYAIATGKANAEQAADESKLPETIVMEEKLYKSYIGKLVEKLVGEPVAPARNRPFPVARPEPGDVLPKNVRVKSVKTDVKTLQIIDSQTGKVVASLPLDEFSEAKIENGAVVVIRKGLHLTRINLEKGFKARLAKFLHEMYVPTDVLPPIAAPPAKPYGPPNPRVEVDGGKIFPTEKRPTTRNSTTQTKPAPKNVSRVVLPPLQSANRQIDLVQLASAYTDARSALEIAQLDIKQRQELHAKSPGVVSERDLALGQLQEKTAARKVQLLHRIIESAMNAAQGEDEVVEQQLKLAKAQQQVGRGDINTLLRLENQRLQIREKLNILRLILKN